MRLLDHAPAKNLVRNEAKATCSAVAEAVIERVHGNRSDTSADLVAVEEPLEIQLGYGPSTDRKTEPIAVTMRTPGHDLELAAGFLVSEGIIRSRTNVAELDFAPAEMHDRPKSSDTPLRIVQTTASANVVRVQLAPELEIDTTRLRRHFYTSSSCGVCGKASLLALETACPPRRQNRFSINAEVLYTLPGRLREAQTIFDRTGGLHGAALFDADGTFISMREDVGRHNAVDKLIGSQFLLDRLPLQDALLMLSGRASFELLQKALMAGVPAVAAVGAPSSLAVAIARQFDIVLVGFARDSRFNVYHGTAHLSGIERNSLEAIQ